MAALLSIQIMLQEFYRSPSTPKLCEAVLGKSKGDFRDVINRMKKERSKRAFMSDDEAYEWLKSLDGGDLGQSLKLCNSYYHGSALPLKGFKEGLKCMASLLLRLV